MTGRATDPATSHLAATYISGKRPGLKDAFLMALQTLGPSTANEIAQWCVQAGVSANAESVRKRAKELIDEQRAKYGPARTCKVTGQQAGTLELADYGNSSVATIEQERAATERRDSTIDSGRHAASGGDSQGAQCQSVAGVRNQATGQVSTLETERIKAVAEFISREREWIDNWRVALDISIAIKAGAHWPAGTSDDYVRAMDAASAQGLIERDGQKVRAKRVAKEMKAIQKGLFE